ncbi:hypothetical protein CUMW_247940 [Citrus unshiu]|uniref:Hydrophobic seed protein domain-containing protein n=1 Tax=Citrus unshiu TaxID=55188 RepID=A0A2H5QNZ3_CITUN|nr:hypothetical protein CUMW_247940 [Citrus unshiu]
MASASKALVLFFTLLIIATSIPSSSATSSSSSCPKNTLKLDACVDLLNGLAKVNLGELVPTPNHPCCSLLGDLVRVQARVCLCTSLKLNVLDLIKLDIPKLSVNLLLNQCRPKNILKLDACVDLLNGLAKVNLGELVPTPNHPCCSLLGDLVRVQARVCLCTSLKLNVLDLIKLDIPKLSVNLLLNQCRPKVPRDYKC